MNYNPNPMYQQGYIEYGEPEPEQNGLPYNGMPQNGFYGQQDGDEEAEMVPWYPPQGQQDMYFQNNQQGMNEQFVMDPEENPSMFYPPQQPLPQPQPQQQQQQSFRRPYNPGMPVEQPEVYFDEDEEDEDDDGDTVSEQPTYPPFREPRQQQMSRSPANSPPPNQVNQPTPPRRNSAQLRPSTRQVNKPIVNERNENRSRDDTPPRRRPRSRGARKRQRRRKQRRQFEQTNSEDRTPSDSNSDESVSPQIDENNNGFDDNGTQDRRKRVEDFHKTRLSIVEDNSSSDNESIASTSTIADNAYMKKYEGTFLDQFCAVMQRTFQQAWRDKIYFSLEFFIPIVFIIVTIGLWGAWGTTNHGTDVFFQESAGYSGYRLNLFYNEPCYTGNPIEHLLKCGSLDDFDYYDTPSYEAGTIPVQGLGIYSSTPNQKVAGVVRKFLGLFLGNRALLPSFDLIVLYQWLAKISQLGDGTSTLVSAGLAPNTRETAIQKSGSLFFVGSTSVTKQLKNYFLEMTSFAQYIGLYEFASLDAANDFISSVKSVWAIIEVKAYTTSSFDVEIHMDKNALPGLNTAINMRYPGGFQFDQTELYVASGFLTLQQMVTDCYLNKQRGAKLNVTHFLGSTAAPPYKQSPLLTYAIDLVPLIYAMSFLYPVSQLTKKIVLEKELKLRESMLIMGLTNFPMYLSWFILYFLEHFVTCFIITILLKVTYVTQSDPFIIFLVFFLFALTTIPLSGLIAAFFSKARLASLMAPIIYFVFAIPKFAMTNASSAVIIPFSLLSPTALAQATLTLLYHEVTGGFTGSSFNDPIDSPTMTVTLVMMFVDFVIYYILMLYLDAVMPKDWGTPKHPLFFLIDPITWCLGGRRKRLLGGRDGRDEDGVFENTECDEDAVILEGLRKSFRRGGKKFKAVNNLYWGMKEGEISVMLGHNGAGKSTTLNMMTGMLEPDAGDCYIYGLSVRQELDKVRQEIGFCPQHNILWPELTCREHLEFFAKIKGLKGWNLEDAVCRMLHVTDLEEKMESPAHALSGGQKRKLSVAIAFVGRSRLVFLDEPTAGMDVGARRHTWELLRRMSETHTILLTTHYMDEADLLGHRIGIMSQGRLKCSGSSLFLKSRLGLGYHITIAIDLTADISQLCDLVETEIPTAEMLNQNGCELSYRLPTEYVNQFPELLAQLEFNRDEFGVRGYSLSATTLEEIFLRVSEEDIAKSNGSNPLSGQGDAETYAAIGEYVWNCEMVASSSAMWSSQFKAMMTKRFFNAIRDRRMQFFQVVCPVVCVLLAMLLNLIKFTTDSGSYLQLSANMYGDDTQININNCQQYFAAGTTSLAGATVVTTSYRTVASTSLKLLDQWYEHDNFRIGAIGCNDTDMMAYTCNVNPIVQLYNSSAPHQSAVNMAAFYEGVFRRVSTSSATYKVAVGVLPSTSSSKNTQVMNMIMVGAIIMIPFTFLPSNPVAWIVKERECKARHLQNLCGLRFVIYWASNFLFDMAAYIITIILVIIIFAIFQRHEYTGTDRIGATIVLFLVYGLTSTVMAYAVSFIFSEHSMAQMVVMAISFVSGFLLVMVVYILSLLDTTKDTSKILRWPFRLIPSYCVGEGIINLAMLSQQQEMGENVYPWSLATIGWACIYMAAEFPVFLLVTLFVDHPHRKALLHCGGSERQDTEADEFDYAGCDSDVEAEREAAIVDEQQADRTSIVLVVGLRKRYPNGKLAVKNLSFGIMDGEVFAFLGTNGAGKTTTIAMLCQEFLPSSGRAYVCGYSVVDDSREALQCIGYCPQFDATLDLLTVEEHLYVYCGIRGIVPSTRDKIVASLVLLCDLYEYRKTLSHELSGGNRRKLNFAISLVGGPQVLLLDEPSAGMDPVARRGLWTAIQRAATNCSVVLTTHHLEEVEALADTVAIMVDGTLRCIGDKTHLKTKFGSGFEMSLRIDSASRKDDVENFVNALLPTATLNEYRTQRFVYALPPGSSLADVFELIQENKTELGITDYSVSQTSIEQVFLRISGETMDGPTRCGTLYNF